MPGILDVIGVGMLGPTIIAHGTDEQKQPLPRADAARRRGLVPALLRAGGRARTSRRSRRAPSLQDDGGWRLSGQKVWTTNAHFASFGMLLARTDPDVPKHKGLTMFIVPMDARGRDDPAAAPDLRRGRSSTRSSSTTSRSTPTRSCGPVGGGWGTALTTLMFERVTIGLGSEAMGYRAERFAARDRGRRRTPRRDPEVRRRLGELCVELLAVKFTGYRTLSALQKGQIPGPEAGLAKITTVRAAIDAGDLIADVLGPDALDDDSEWALHDLVPAGAEVRRRDGGDPAQHRRRARARAAAGAAAGQGHPVLRAAREGARGGVVMNLELTDEQTFLRDAARDALSRVATVAAARAALEDPAALPDLWPTACEAGWPGLLVERGARRRGAERVRRDARHEEAGRVLAGVGAARATCPRRSCSTSAAIRGSSAVAEGELRACFVARAPAGRRRATAGRSRPRRASLRAPRRCSARTGR